MNTQNFVGIDVSKSALDVAVVGSDQTIATVSNDARGHENTGVPTDTSFP